MEINVKSDKEEIDVVCKPLLQRQVDQGFNLLLDAEKANEEDAFDRTKKFLDFIDKMIIERTNLTSEQKEEAYADDVSKIAEYYSKQVQSKMDFLKSSLQSENSVPKEKTG